ncbi:Zinc finger CCCH domain-containing protein 48 [Glycine soja]
MRFPTSSVQSFEFGMTGPLDESISYFLIRVDPWVLVPIAFRGMHALTFRGLHSSPSEDYTSLPSEDYTSSPSEEYTSSPSEGYRSSPSKEYRSLAFRGLHVLTIRGLHVLTFRGLHVLTFRGLHTLTFRGQHVLPFRGLHALTFRGLHLFAFKGLHALAFRGLHVLTFIGLHALAFRGLHVLTFKGLHTLAFSGLHALTFQSSHLRPKFVAVHHLLYDCYFGNGKFGSQKNIMDTKFARRTERIGRTTCSYWRAGKCNRNPCRFVHIETPSPPAACGYGNTAYSYGKKPHSSSENTPKYGSKKALLRDNGDRGDATRVAKAFKKSSPRICKYWINNNCVHGEQCLYLHSWFRGDGFSTVTKLQEHKKVITGIALPVGSDKLYSGSTDGTVRIWDCHTGQCAKVINLGAEVTSLISEGSWIFVGLQNAVKAWNIQTMSEFTLDGPKGRVRAMTVGNNTLFAGAEDGVIFAWRGSSKADSPFELVASLTGHTKAVVCLAVGCKMLYSGSMDQSIKVWDMDTLQCTMTLNDHTDAVTSLICWDQYLLSSSSDCTIKVWACIEAGSLEVIYTHTEENGVVSLFGMPDAEGKPILFSSCRDNSVHMYELPSFSERGRLFAKKDVALIELGPGGLFFTGDESGLLMNIMDTKFARRTERIGSTTCSYWRAGRCNRNPCRFLHIETPSPPAACGYGNTAYSYGKKPHSSSENTPKYGSKKALLGDNGDRGDATRVAKPFKKSSPRICKYWINNNCVHGEQCLYLHSWFRGDGFSTVTKLHEHKKVITGIALPVGSDKLYSGSTDGTVRIWDCHTGQCAKVINLGAEVTSLISEGSWIFVGLQNAVKAWNIQTMSEFTLDGPKGRVCAMTVGNNTLFAGAEDGVIFAWRGSSKADSPFELVASLTGHTKAVVCLAVGCKMLYSGSMDQSIKVWDMDTLQCTMTLNDHTDVVTSLICWDQYLLSSSSDRTIKVWACIEAGSLEVIYTHTEENGVVSLFGMPDAEGKPILFSSCRDNSVHMYELPSFSERGRLFAKKDVALIELGPGGLFFTGDESENPNRGASVTLPRRFREQIREDFPSFFTVLHSFFGLVNDHLYPIDLRNQEKKSISMNLGSMIEREEKRLVYRVRCSCDENNEEEEMEEGIGVLSVSGLHALTFRGLHALFFRGLHVLAFIGLHVLVFKGLYILAFRGLHVLAFRGLHILPFRGLHVITFRGLHALAFKGLHTLTFRGLHVLTLRGVHVLPFRGLQDYRSLAFRGLHVLTFRGLHVLTFRGLHVLAFRGLHILTFRGLHVLPFRGLHALTFRGLHLFAFKGLQVLAFRGLHVLAFIGLHALAFRGLHVLTFRGLHVLAFIGLHALAFRGLHVLTFRGLHLFTFKGLHALAFKGLHVLAFIGLHTLAFRGLHALAFRGLHVLTFRGLHTLTFRGLQVLAFRGLHVLAFRGLHICAFRELKFLGHPLILEGDQLCKHNQRRRLSHNYYAYRAKISPSRCKETSVDRVHQNMDDVCFSERENLILLLGFVMDDLRESMVKLLVFDPSLQWVLILMLLIFLDQHSFVAVHHLLYDCYFGNGKFGSQKNIMDTKFARRTERIGRTTCSYWRAGKCNRNPCRFLHIETPSPPAACGYGNTAYSYGKKPHSSSENTPKYGSKKALLRDNGDRGDATRVAKAFKKSSPRICKYWINNNCVHGEQCLYLHSWFRGDGFSTVTKLQEHKTVITGIALPVGSDKLYSGSTDGTVRIWDCHTGQCAKVINLGAEVASLISEGSWIFVGLQNAVKAWNIQTMSEFTLDGPKGRVRAMTVGNNTLFAGAEDGVIFAWRGSSKADSPFELVASLTGHTKAVVCLAVGCKMLYSGSMDQSIKVWDMDTLQCTMTLNDHTDAVTSLICWDQYLLSSSSDRTIKVWACIEAGSLEVIYTHTEENGVVSLFGMPDAEGKPILFSSCRDNSVHMYELPSFSERGRLFAKKDVALIELGPGGLFFTGDESGLLMVWKWLEKYQFHSFIFFPADVIFSCFDKYITIASIMREKGESKEFSKESKEGLVNDHLYPIDLRNQEKKSISMNLGSMIEREEKRLVYRVRCSSDENNEEEEMEEGIGNIMDTKFARRTERIGRTTCSYWRAGKCNRNPCRFVHIETPSPPAACGYGNTAYSYGKKPHSSSENTPKYGSKKALLRDNGDRGDAIRVAKAFKKSSPRICKYWINNNCVHGEQCLYLYSWFRGDGFSTVTKLQEHKKVITGIALPVGSDKLYSGSTDGTVRIWDCHTGQCAKVINLGAEVASLISEGSWIFVGLQNAVKAWNIQTMSEFTLDGPKGRVRAMTVGNNTLFAGAEDGVIFAWRGSSKADSPFELVASLTGHTKAVVWHMDTLQCTMTLNDHTDAVTSLICWDQYLLSSSSDRTIKVWACIEAGSLEVIYTHTEENGVVSLFGMPDAEGKPILFSSCRDNSVHMYELPSFSERGRLFAKKDVALIELGPGGLFFTGDESGLLMVWKWLERCFWGGPHSPIWPQPNKSSNRGYERLPFSASLEQAGFPPIL